MSIIWVDQHQITEVHVPAAFDTIDHNVVITHLSSWLGNNTFVIFFFFFLCGKHH